MAKHAQVANMKTAQIVELYNAMQGEDGKTVKKFADRATAEARLVAALDAAGMTVVTLEDGQFDVVNAKAAKAAKAAKKAKTTGGKRGPAPKFADTLTIKAVADNPKKAGTAAHERFGLYKIGATVADFVAAGGRRDDIIYDVKKGHVQVA